MLGKAFRVIDVGVFSGMPSRVFAEADGFVKLHNFFMLASRRLLAPEQLQAGGLVEREALVARNAG